MYAVYEPTTVHCRHAANKVLVQLRCSWSCFEKLACALGLQPNKHERMLAIVERCADVRALCSYHAPRLGVPEDDSMDSGVVHAISYAVSVKH
jgi:hypothetical protein